MTAPAGRGRAYGVALALLALGGLLLLVGYGLVWATAQVPLLPGADAADSALRTKGFTGRDLYPGAAAMGWVVFAAVGGIVATRSWGRVGVAVIALIAGLTALAASVDFARAPGVAVDAAVSALAGTESYVASTSTSSWFVAALSGALVALVAAVVAVRGRRWPSLGRRYGRTPARPADMSAWDAQDNGRDPTDDLVE